MANPTQVERLPLRLKRMVAQTRSMVIVTTNSEARGALLLEARRSSASPAFNVLLRDDKAFPFILLPRKHDFPRTKHRGARRPRLLYGPFASAGSVNTTINALQKLFLLQLHRQLFSRRDRPACSTRSSVAARSCVGGSTRPVRNELVAEAKDFLGGRSSAVQKKAQMAQAAEALDFESAAMLLRDTAPPPSSSSGQAVNAQGAGDADVFAIASRNGQWRTGLFFHPAAGRTGATAPSSPATPTGWTKRVLTAFLAQF